MPAACERRANYDYAYVNSGWRDAAARGWWRGVADGAEVTSGMED
jgi:hypothetical protein